jgi:hypothetical protein
LALAYFFAFGERIIYETKAHMNTRLLWVFSSTMGSGEIEARGSSRYPKRSKKLDFIDILALLLISVSLMSGY